MTSRVSKALRTLRDISGLKIAELKDATGVSMPMICQIESGRRNVTISTLRLLASAYGIPVEALLYYEMEKGSIVLSDDARRVVDKIDKVHKAQDELNVTIQRLKK